MNQGFEASLSYAQQKDREDPLRNFRSEFYFPKHQGSAAIYFCGNSLGLQPRNVQASILQELNDWRDFGVEGYHEAKNPWLYYQELFQQPLSKIAGCLPHEITVMNSLTVNLHLMLFSFYQPDKRRNKIMMEAGAFPSDQYAVETQVRLHGLDPQECI
jgi:kynureninase